MKRRDANSIHAVGIALALLAACGSDGKSALTTAVVVTTSATAAESTSSVGTTTVVPPTTAAAPTVPPTTPPTAPTTTEPATIAPATTTSVAAQSRQVAIWPAADVVFASPEAAATDFVTKAFGFSPTLGTFEQGDTRSGEISVLLGEASSPPTLRSTLVLRQLGPDDGWFVVSAINVSMTIDAPVAQSTVPSGELQVSGTGRGFEALIVVEAFVAGSADKLDTQTALAGSAETAEPFTVALDVSGAHAGDTVVILIRGGVGLENDPGEFSALAVTITG